ncbi:hypothetical protein Sste5346_001503 [Sporothrix stenoceras]|uniref:CMP/dCMP-type deaminase domain-containing protein n=1 Tax=Sporothrix stenoceras TaxID=5173 RepID=A0ABR3ZNZ9_9PEZI
MHIRPSAKSDNYLNLCLEQAELSPLNFWPGAIVVKGGKVLGAGFNDHRPGYDGGNVYAGTSAPLSMHSDMMAINMALGGQAAGMRNIKANRGTKHGGTKQRRKAVEEYVEAILRASIPSGGISSDKKNSRPSLTEMAEDTERGTRRRRWNTRLADADLYVARLAKPNTCNQGKMSSVDACGVAAILFTTGVVTDVACAATMVGS